MLKSILHHLQHHKFSIMIFLFVGTLSACVNLGSFSLLWGYFHLNYQIAVSIAYMLSVSVHFSANKYFTFDNHDTNVFPQLQRYIIMLLINYCITLTIVHIVVEYFHYSPYVGIIVAIGFTVNISYSMSRFWIFQKIDSYS